MLFMIMVLMTLVSQRGTVSSIWIALNKGEPMLQLDCALAERNGGLRDAVDPDLIDRYHARVKLGAFSRQGRGTTMDVSLLAAEAIEAARVEGARTPLGMFHTRRNIELRGFGPDLTVLMHKQLRLGGAVLYVMGPCEPCERPNKLAQRRGEYLDSFKQSFGEGGGGVRARVMDTGVIAVADEVFVMQLE